MKFLFKRRPRPGYIKELSGSEILFYGRKQLPSDNNICDFIFSVSTSSLKWKLPTNYVIRDSSHVLSWISSFLAVEKEDLEDRFSSELKSYESWVIVSRELAALDLIIRLSTVGITGYTEYCISIIRIGEDDFLCVE